MKAIAMRILESCANGHVARAAHYDAIYEGFWGDRHSVRRESLIQSISDRYYQHGDCLGVINGGTVYWISCAARLNGRKCKPPRGAAGSKLIAHKRDCESARITNRAEMRCVSCETQDAPTVNNVKRGIEARRIVGRWIWAREDGAI